MGKITRTWKRYFSFRGLSIQQRLPLLIGVLLLSVIISFGIISYFSVKKSSEKSGHAHVQNLGDRIGNILAQSTQAMIIANRDAATDSSVTHYLETRQDTTKLFALMEQLGKDTQTVMVDLVDKSYNSLFRYAKSFAKPGTGLDKLKIKIPPKDSTRIGKLRQVGDSLFYPVISPVRLHDSVAAYLVKWRLLYNSPRALEQLAQYIGTDAKIFLGNADNSNWTNMMKPIPNPIPPSARQVNELLAFSNAEGTEVLGSLRLVKQAPWQVIVTLPAKSITEPARSFLRQLLIISFILITGGLLIGWHVSRNITSPLKELTVASVSLANGDYTTSVPMERRDEVGKLSRSFNAMSTQVSRVKKELEKKVEEARHMNEHLRDFSARLENVREEERKHIAREMHDELGQFLTGLKMDLRWLDKRIPDNKENAEAREKISEMTTAVDEAVLFVRKLAAELRPSILDDLGLVAALEWHSQEFSKRFNIEVEFRSEVQDIKTTPAVATGLFRMYQESLTNVARHASANKVTAYLEADDFIKLSIRDDGKGFDIEGVGSRKTLGLLGMRERAFMIGGKIDIISSLGEGTTIIIKVPMHLTEAAL